MEKPFAFKVENIEGDEVTIMPNLDQASLLPKMTLSMVINLAT